MPLIKTLKGHVWQVNSVSFSPDGKYVASGSWDKTVKVWNVSSGELMKTLEGHPWHVYSVSFSPDPDGASIVSGSRDMTVKVWSVESGECVTTFEGHSYYVNSVSFSPDGASIVSGSEDNTVKVWSVDVLDVSSTIKPSSTVKPYKKLYEGLLKQIDTFNLRQLLRDYTYRYDIIIARWLFKGEIKQYEGSPKITKNEICRHILALDLAFKLALPLQRETIVYRGSDKSDLKRRRLIDGKWTHKSYLSTTPSMVSTKQFLDLDGDCCVDQIILPKGMQVLPLFEELTEYPHECEFLLPRNTTFVEVTHPQNVYYDELDMELVTSFWKIDNDTAIKAASIQPQLKVKAQARKQLPRLKL